MVLAALALSAPVARASPWQGALATLAAPDAQPTVAGLGAMLAPFGGAAITAGCQMTPGPAPAGAPGIAAATLQALGDCAAGAPVVRVQILLQPIDAAGMAQLRVSLRRVAGPPCFDGVYAANPRRRAPPLHFLAWSGVGRDLVLTQDSSIPDGVSVTFLRRGLHPADAATKATYDGLLGAAQGVLPAACRAAG